MQKYEYDLAKKEYAMHQKLFQAKVEAETELKQQESKLIAKQYPLQQSQSSLLLNSSLSSSKQKELLELNSEAKEEQLKFFQSLNSLISEIEKWKDSYVLSASQNGKVAFSGNIQNNRVTNVGEELFYIYTNLDQVFFAEAKLSQFSMGKVKLGQDVLIKLDSYPFEEFGVLRGKITTISEVAYRDSVFISKIEISKPFNSSKNNAMKLREGLSGQAEIMTENVSLFNKIGRNIFRLLKN